ncbi:MAG TPA: outer membrane lipoprotein carrier protein LolA [Chitinophagaceae bacterium]|nr:outer membrane lipoprotein carrier protein LolA [Chitinophagaceae bacterium]
MKKFYITIILAMFGLFVFAQTRDTKSDPDAIAILNAVSVKFKTFSTVQASFAYKVEDAKGKTMSAKKGTVLMKGTKYRVSFGGQEIFSDGKTVWSYDKSANEVTVNSLDAGSGMITPQKLFTNFYENDFYSVMNGVKKIGARSIQEIEMTPKDKSKPFHKVYLQIDKNAKTIYSTKVLENGGNRYTYTVSTMKTNATLADNQFVFDKNKYPGVEVVDLR